MTEEGQNAPDAVTFESVVREIEDSSLIRSYLESALEARKEDGIPDILRDVLSGKEKSWLNVESYEVDSGSYGFLAVFAEDDAKWRLVTSFAPESVGDPTEVLEGIVVEYELTKEDWQAVVSDCFAGSPIRGSWGDHDVFDGVVWLLSDHKGTRCLLYGYDVPILDENEEVVTSPASGDPHRGVTIVSGAIRVWLQVRERKPTGTRKTRL